MLIFIYRKETFNNLREGVFMKNNHNKDYNPPMMGWSSWNAFKINLNEDIVKEQTRLMKELGLLACGYSYINIEDGFFGGREKNKVLYSNDKTGLGAEAVLRDSSMMNLQEKCMKRTDGNFALGTTLFAGETYYFEVSSETAATFEITLANAKAIESITILNGSDIKAQVENINTF